MKTDRGLARINTDYVVTVITGTETDKSTIWRIWRVDQFIS